MKSKLLNFIKYLILFTICMGSIQYFVVEYLLSDTYFYYSTVSIYSFLSIVTLLLYIGILFVNNSYPQYTGYAFMASGFLKMLLAIVFLLPIMMKKDDNSYVADVLAFFVSYFLFLLLETIFIVQLLKTDKK